MMFYQILVQSSRGSDLLMKEYREDGIPKFGDVFSTFLKKNHNENDLLPVMEVGGKYIIHIKCNGLYFICSASQDEPPFAALQLLERLSGLVKDFCGIISEEAIVQNTALVYELLDEIMDYGIIITTSTRNLKPYIQTEPVPVKADRQIEGILGVAPGLFGSDFQIAPSNSPDKPLALSQHSKALGSQKNEVYLDIIERITVLVSASGSVIQSELNGTVHLRSFLIGNPELVIGLSEDLVIGRGSPDSCGPGVRLDHVQFHPAISLAEFEQQRVLRTQSQEGETIVMKYGISNHLSDMLPFQVEASMTEITEKQIVDVELQITCHIDQRHHAVNVKVNLPIPKATTDVSPSLPSQTHTMEYKRGDRSIVWCIKKMIGGTKHTAKLRIHLDHLSSSTLIEIGPASLEFELKDFTSSKLQIRFLKVFDKHNSYVPFRWVRYATLSDSYVIRLR